MEKAIQWVAALEKADSMLEGFKIKTVPLDCSYKKSISLHVECHIQYQLPYLKDI